jgi:hypothetical protein
MEICVVIVGGFKMSFSPFNSPDSQSSVLLANDKTKQKQSQTNCDAILFEFQKTLDFSLPKFITPMPLNWTTNKFYRRCEQVVFMSFACPNQVRRLCL